MSEISAVDARNQFSELVNRVAYGKERIILTRRGREIAAVVPIEDVRLLEDLEERLDLEEARTALASARTEGTTSWEQLKSDLDL